MTTIEALRNFWQALPDSAPFNSFFDAEIVNVQSADREIERAEAALAAAKARKAEELSTLARYVELAAKREWTQEQIDAAKGAAEWAVRRPSEQEEETFATEAK